jgi:hypothetical protein
MQHAISSFLPSSPLLALVAIAFVAATAPVAAHTYPNYAYPEHVRTSHALSALTLSGEKIAFIRPLPRRAIGVINSNLTFAVELVRTCSGGGGGSSSSSNMDCTLYLDGNSAHNLSLPCDQPITVALTAAAPGECHSTGTNTPTLAHSFSGAATVVAACSTGLSGEDSAIVSTQTMLLEVDPSPSLLSRPLADAFSSAAARLLRCNASSAPLRSQYKGNSYHAPPPPPPHRVTAFLFMFYPDSLSAWPRVTRRRLLATWTWSGTSAARAFAMALELQVCAAM